MKTRKANDSSLPETPKTDVERRVWISEYKRISKWLVTVINMVSFSRGERLAKLLPNSEKERREAIALQQETIIDQQRALSDENRQLYRHFESLFSTNKKRAEKAAKKLCDEAIFLAGALQTASSRFPELFAPIACESGQWPVLISTKKPKDAEARFILPSHPLAFLHLHELWVETSERRHDFRQATIANQTATALLNLVALVKTTQECLAEYPIKGVSLDRLIPAKLLEQINPLPPFSQTAMKQYLEVCRTLLDFLCGGSFENDPQLARLGEHRKNHTSSQPGKFTSVRSNIRDGIWKRIKEALVLIAKKTG